MKLLICLFLFFVLMRGYCEASKIRYGSFIKLSSEAFKNNGAIPVKYANEGFSDGENKSIPLSWTKPPKAAKSLAISMVDTSAGNFIHWLVVNVPLSQTALPQGASVGKMPEGSDQLLNDFGTIGYGGPTPPEGTGTHNYVITIYALNADKINLKMDTSLSDFQKEISGKILSQASLAGKMSWQK